MCFELRHGDSRNSEIKKLVAHSRKGIEFGKLYIPQGTLAHKV
jgi:hypothetical protein